MSEISNGLPAGTATLGHRRFIGDLAGPSGTQKYLIDAYVSQNKAAWQQAYGEGEPEVEFNSRRETWELNWRSKDGGRHAVAQTPYDKYSAGYEQIRQMRHNQQYAMYEAQSRAAAQAQTYAALYGSGIGAMGSGYAAMVAQTPHKIRQARSPVPTWVKVAAQVLASFTGVPVRKAYKEVRAWQQGKGQTKS